MTKFKSLKLQAGFSIIEIITILFIISVALTGMITLITQSVKGEAENKNTLIAYQLAQEGIELVRGIRDNNWRQGQDWNEGLAPGDYYLDIQNTNYQLEAARDIPEYGRLGRSMSGFYVSAPESKLGEGEFARIIKITSSEEEPYKIGIRSSVYWRTGRTYKIYFIDTDLYDWL
ncbi:MAG: type IV pilus modification PilV family protein [Patescibacteria group bacterium]|jgi:type II secretory pathway pseudopilin PulG